MTLDSPQQMQTLLHGFAKTQKAKMLIPVCGPENGEVPEWAMVELQGRIEQLGPEEEQELQRELGILHADAKDSDAVVLVVGYHRLEGKRIPFKKPFAVSAQGLLQG